MVTATKWRVRGEYFENCNCDLLCPCEVAPEGPLAAPPTQGHCDIVLAFHIDDGNYGDASLSGLNVTLVGLAPGPMGQGNWKMAVYLDDRADEQQREGLMAIFGGDSGGPMGGFKPLIGEMLGVKSVPMTYTVEGKRRTLSIPDVASMGVEAVPSMHADGSEVWLSLGHPFNPERLAVATGVQGSTYVDYGMTWDNSGKNGHYAPIDWSGP